MLSFLKKDPQVIQFVCHPEDDGVIAPPLPAKSVLPDWFRRLPAVDKGHLSATDNGLTVKRCMPFLDAMTTGWILPIAATVRLDVKDDGRSVDAGWEFDRVMVSNHGAHQVAGNPKEPSPPCKFHNYWSIRTPPGWSCLFLPPLNRPGQPFECVAGIVDTDSYSAHIHFPFFATAPDGLHVVEKGTPLVQVIPFRRADAAVTAEIRAETRAEATEREAIHRNTLAGEGWYRKSARAAR
ncbi:hypothetical protein ACVMB3_004882 [Sinorhizobium meliloti]|uniref:DUF6065 family protein n=1 Tax=Rhizobium meliloti TaxID=382 RepID=UPI0002E2CA5D|nr:DUF6065 family protein [Sinorhizobium meliloti]AIM02467.1 hypothetical protein DU99_25035 [Sinorhizobium meliloti]ASQ02192.1 hypothetical protein CDO24_33965 [Sinorhizobium meliloti]ATA95036.1 hypothetical protein BWO76_00585 [Sinorhizobium meliloti]ATB00731.1 hypothetical protein BWO90_00400 [Sinorhizobium meliloti]MDE3788911.1 hypothetical protein [Sinorhizobium meliloti]